MTGKVMQLSPQQSEALSGDMPCRARIDEELTLR